MVQTKEISTAPRVLDQAPAPTAPPTQTTFASPSDMRQLIPPLGLKQYWYPALEDRAVKNKPVGVKICGVDLVFFRDKKGEVSCLWNVCPHRGGSLMHGDCHFPGTISCPYHGWTFDGEGNVLAVFPEGPESKIPGRVVARKYPTRTLKGMVFVWMGDGEPAPIEEDVPPEFFDATTRVFIHTEYWPVHWNVALENGGDAHVPYVHRNSMAMLMQPVGFASALGSKQTIISGRAVAALSAGYGDARQGQAKQPYQRYFPALGGYWPKHRWRLLWTWGTALARKRAANQPPWDWPEEWTAGSTGGGEHHLPGMYRRDYGTHFYTRQSVPVTENLSRQIYYRALRPANWLSRAWQALSYKLYGRWAMYTNFSEQDFRAVAPQRYDTQEHLSPTDIHQIYWRRLVLQARGMMRAEAAAAIPTTDAEKFSSDVQHKEPATPQR
ncbi:MAG: Rieske 2Fe-2S domain-containing protein [Chloroflexi bacterium]|nr:Rieske 2Fe-2S domain-containing protein [Chloroflexota bacterium]